MDRLWASFENSDPSCSCNIAMEHGRFMRALSKICVPADAAWEQRHLHTVVSQMLHLDSYQRIGIETVKLELGKLLRHG